MIDDQAINDLFQNAYNKIMSSSYALSDAGTYIRNQLNFLNLFKKSEETDYNNWLRKVPDSENFAYVHFDLIETFYKDIFLQKIQSRCEHEISNIIHTKAYKLQRELFSTAKHKRFDEIDINSFDICFVPHIKFADLNRDEFLKSLQTHIEVIQYEQYGCRDVFLFKKDNIEIKFLGENFINLDKTPTIVNKRYKDDDYYFRMFNKTHIKNASEGVIVA